jgi:hypothetical protein
MGSLGIVVKIACPIIYFFNWLEQSHSAIAVLGKP